MNSLAGLLEAGAKKELQDTLLGPWKIRRAEKRCKGGKAFEPTWMRKDKNYVENATQKQAAQTIRNSQLGWT